MKKIIKRILLVFLISLLILIGYLFIGKPPQAKEITWGVNFSQKHARDLGLNWQETYLALLDDLGAKNIKLATYWDLIEQGKDEYTFEDLDWQINEAEKKGVNLLLVIGMKTGRWPECHIPDWAKNLSKEEQQREILEILEKIVLRYRGRVSVWAWQVENEPFFPFGECPWVDKKFVKEEIDLVKNLDPPPYYGGRRPVLISDSGEGSFWIGAARLGDIVGTTMYEKVWFTPLEIFSKIQKLMNLPSRSEGGRRGFILFALPEFIKEPREFGFYLRYPFPPTFYWRKARIIEKFFNKETICIELQTEPWGPKLLYDSPLKEQEKTMNLAQFQKNIEFAKKTGLKKFYLWGAEWWYWMKEKQNRPEIWNEAKNLF